MQDRNQERNIDAFFRRIAQKNYDGVEHILNDFHTRSLLLNDIEISYENKYGFVKEYGLVAGMTAFHVAAKSSTSEMLELLIAKLNDRNMHVSEKTRFLDKKDSAGYTALHYAARRDNYEIVNCLALAGANVNTETDDQETAYGLTTVQSIRDMLVNTHHANVPAQQPPVVNYPIQALPTLFFQPPAAAIGIHTSSSNLSNAHDGDENDSPPSPWSSMGSVAISTPHEIIKPRNERIVKQMISIK